MKRTLITLFCTAILLFGLRHLNTVPHREWSFTNVYKRGEIWTLEGLLGSWYRISDSSKNIPTSDHKYKSFAVAYLTLWGSNDWSRATLRLIDK